MRLPDVDKRVAWAGGILRWTEAFLIAAFLIFRLYTSFHTPSPVMSPVLVPQAEPERVEDTFQLKRGPFSVYRYEPGQTAFAAHPKAIILFESGDGGLDGWEDRVCKALQADGYEMIAFDCAFYSRSDYDLDVLQADMGTLAQSYLSSYGDHPPPLILGGWSMGAEQAVAAAGGPHRPAGVVGLLLISPGPRGRYGLRSPDRWDVAPTGPGTFALQDFAHDLEGLRIVQWNGNFDLLGSKVWLSSLTAPYKAFGYPYGLHDYNGASDDFLAHLKQSISWILAPPASGSGP